jgi:putative chitinase
VTDYVLRYDLKRFFDAIRPTICKGKITLSQVQGFQFLIEAYPLISRKPGLKELAYLLATAWHETGYTMLPIHEWGDADYFNRRYDTRTDLGNTPEKDGDGALFAGRGYVQITGRANYRKATKRLRELGLIPADVDFEKTPGLVMYPAYAVLILIIGSEEGWFTNKRLDQYFKPGFADPVNARRIINGTDKAETIAGHYHSIVAALLTAEVKL